MIHYIEIHMIVIRSENRSKLYIDHEEFGDETDSL